MGLCIKLRGGIQVMFSDGYQFPPKLIKAKAAYDAECRLLNILSSAGLDASFDLDEQKFPTALRITVPAGTDITGVPEKDEHLKIMPSRENDGQSRLTVGLQLTEHVGTPAERAVFPRQYFKIAFLQRISARYQWWRYRRAERYLKKIIPGVGRHLLPPWFGFGADV